VTAPARFAQSFDQVLARTRTLMARQERLSRELGEILSDCARVRRQSPVTIQGGARSEDDDGLRRQVRAWLVDGRLPMPGAEMWVGTGSDRECAICAETVTRSQIEYEIPSRSGWLYVHLACFTLWKSEAAALGGKASADGAAAAD
jgi:hypothetical protein